MHSLNHYLPRNVHMKAKWIPVIFLRLTSLLKLGVCSFVFCFFFYAPLLYLITRACRMAEDIKYSTWKDFNVLWPPEFSFFGWKAIRHTSDARHPCGHHQCRTLSRVCLLREGWNFPGETKNAAYDSVYFIRAGACLVKIENKINLCYALRYL